MSVRFERNPFFAMRLFRNSRPQNSPSGRLTLSAGIEAFVKEQLINDAFVENSESADKARKCLWSLLVEQFQHASESLFANHAAVLRISGMCEFHMRFIPDRHNSLYDEIQVELYDSQGSIHEKYSSGFAQCLRYEQAVKCAHIDRTIYCGIDQFSTSSENYDRWIDFAPIATAISALPTFKISGEEIVQKIAEQYEFLRRNIDAEADLALLGHYNNIEIRCSIESSMGKPALLDVDGARLKLHLQQKTLDWLEPCPPDLKLVLTPLNGYRHSLDSYTYIPVSDSVSVVALTLDRLLGMYM